MNFNNMAGIYLFYNNKILMMKRKKKDFNGEGKYFSIGGKFENDELNNPKKCILRELEEETGIKEKDLNNLQLKYVIFRNYDGVIVQNHFFFADLVNEVDLKECIEGTFEWVPIEDIFNKPLPISSKVCLEHYFKKGKNSSSVIIAASTNKNGYGEYHFTELLQFDSIK